jgi:hypothetical protein
MCSGTWKILGGNMRNEGFCWKSQLIIYAIAFPVVSTLAFLWKERLKKKHGADTLRCGWQSWLCCILFMPINFCRMCRPDQESGWHQGDFSPKCPGVPSWCVMMCFFQLDVNTDDSKKTRAVDVSEMGKVPADGTGASAQQNTPEQV